MNQSLPLLALVLAALMATLLCSAALLTAWRQWLDLRRTMLTAKGHEAGVPDRGRTELTDLRARVRRLEAIANGEAGAPSR